MSFHHSPRIVTNGLVTYLDIGNPKCYPISGTTSYDLVSDITASNGSDVTFQSSNLGYFNYSDTTFTGTEIQVDDMVNLFGTGSTEFTVSVWCRYSTSDAQQHIFFVGPQGKDGFGEEDEFHINRTATGEVQMFWNGDSGGDLNITSSNVGDEFFNVTVVCYDMTTGPSNTAVSGSMYIDGAVVGDDLWTDVNRGTFSGSFVRLGRANTQIRRFEGDIAVLQIYNRALTEQEALQNFNALRGRFNI